MVSPPQRLGPESHEEGTPDEWVSASFLDRRLLEKRVLTLIGDVDEEKMGLLVSDLLLLDQDSMEPITLYISSGGGDVYPMLMAYDIIQSLRSPVSTVCLGQACSAAAVLLAGGSPGRRLAYPSATVMMHPGWVGGIHGSIPDVASAIKHSVSLDDRIWKILSRHTGQSTKKIMADCRSERYFSATEARRYGFVDKVVPWRRKAGTPKRKRRAKRA